MTNFDKILNMAGVAASGILIAGLSGGISVPAWLLIVCAGVQTVTGATAAPMLRKGPQTGIKGGAKGQAEDGEEPGR
jgi:hypothetical protein